MSDQCRLSVQAFAALMDRLRADRLLAPHFRYYVREVRVVAYTQVITSTQSRLLRVIVCAGFEDVMAVFESMAAPGMFCTKLVCA